jgi:hypothetical protein
MRYLIFLTLLLLPIWGCSYHWFEESYPDILEAEKQQVDGCALLGVISETADAANPWSFAAKQNMIFIVRERAGQLGATHIVWLHRTASMGTAEAYNCR